MGIEIPEWLKSEMRLRFELMREDVNRNPRLIAGITLASVFILLIVIISLLIPNGKPQIKPVKYEWYYDLNTEQLFVARADQGSLIDAPSGLTDTNEPAGVKAYVFTYDSGTEPNDYFIGFLEKPDPNYVPDDSAAGTRGGYGVWAKGKLIKRPEDEKWYSASSREGRWIWQKAFSPNDDGQSPRYYPAKK